nr:MAG TPA: hypothetical protein [Caudoviricetes sp.]
MANFKKIAQLNWISMKQLILLQNILLKLPQGITTTSAMDGNMLKNGKQKELHFGLKLLIPIR